MAGAFAKFVGIFALTQVPLALGEGVLSVLIFNQLLRYNSRELEELGVTLVHQGARP
jgi:cobalt/nickel transport system permease protein